jgi:aspartyl protease family protein
LGFVMRQLVFFAVVLVVAGSYAARFADRAVETHTEPQAAVVEPAIELLEPSTSGRTLMLQSDRQGHFQVEARVEGRFVDFVVDTGVSLVVLRESSAALAGIRMSPRDYTTTAVTANGRIKAAPAKIDRIEVGGITVYDVPAMVLPDEVLSKKPARCLIPVAAQALRIRQRPLVARTVVRCPSKSMRSAFRASSVRVWDLRP